jgi:hypothetical protein
MIWIPGSHHMEPLGLSDSREEVLTYLQSLITRRTPAERLAEVPG